MYTKTIITFGGLICLAANWIIYETLEGMGYQLLATGISLIYLILAVCLLAQNVPRRDLPWTGIIFIVLLLSLIDLSITTTSSSSTISLGGFFFFLFWTIITEALLSLQLMIEAKKQRQNITQESKGGAIENAESNSQFGSRVYLQTTTL